MAEDDLNLVGKVLIDTTGVNLALRAVGDSIKGMGGLTAAGIVAAGVAVGGITEIAKSSIDKFEEVAGQTRQLGFVMGGTTEDVSRMRFAAQETNTSVEQLTTGMKKLSTGIEGGGAALKGAGIQFTDANGKLLPMNDTMLNIAQKFQSMPDGIEKNALAVQLFGKSGLQLIPMLDRGKDGLTAFEKESDKLGLTLSQNNIDAFRRNIAAHKEFQAALEGLQVQLGANLLPILTAFIEFLNSSMMPTFEALQVVITNDVKPAIDAFMGGLENPDATIGPGMTRLQSLFTVVGIVVHGAFTDAKTAFDAFVDGFKSNASIGDQVSGMQIAFALLGAAVRDVMAALKEIAGWMLNHKQLVNDTALAVGGLYLVWKVFEVGQEVYNGVNNFIGLVGSLKGKIDDAVTSAGNLKDKLGGIGAPKETGVTMGREGFEAKQVESGAGGFVGGALKNAGPAIATAAGGIGAMLTETLLPVLAEVGASIAAVLFAPAVLIGAAVAAIVLLIVVFHDQILAGFSIIGTWLVQAGTDLVNGLITGATAALNGITYFFSNLPIWIAYALGYVLGTLYAGGRDLLTGLWNGAKDVWNDVSKWASELAGAVVKAVGDVTKTLDRVGHDLINGLWSAIQLAWNDPLRFFLDIATAVPRAIGYVAKTLWNVGSDLIGGLWGAIQQGWTNIYNFATGLPGAVVKAVGSLLTTLKQAGIDLIQGLLDGINSMWHNITDLAGKVGGGFLKGFKDAVKSGSPSQAMADEGINLGEGLSIGIEKSRALVQSAVANLSGDVLGQVTPAAFSGAAFAGAGSTTTITVGDIQISGVKDADSLRAVLPDLTNAIKAGVGAG